MPSLLGTPVLEDGLVGDFLGLRGLWKQDMLWNGCSIFQLLLQNNSRTVFELALSIIEGLLWPVLVKMEALVAPGFVLCCPDVVLYSFVLCLHGNVVVAV